MKTTLKAVDGIELNQRIQEWRAANPTAKNVKIHPFELSVKPQRYGETIDHTDAMSVLIEYEAT